ncbi:potassium/sodium hyperpolarization-activated cyclic nucleotide-gated channel 1-like [Colletes gigas]|uniref:potassium/sodium hyperpolarization-activated cyclic nucleotide-gated channel 1-like n=1 Tax=Colletes gigas TaxID=935657 RepID=UPI001C9A7B14|nr:potassium/sodium hyperpolarization-activated cyclic nucleotide-gated channel 1-like [Colletes gigas]
MREHVCGLSKSLENMHQFGSVINMKDVTYHQLWMNLFKISGNTPRSRLFLDSMAAVAAECTRHAALKHSWIIHPFSTFRFVWDLIMSVIYLIAFVSIPFVICFIVMNHEGIRLDKYNLFIYAFCWLDIFCNCVTGYKDKKRGIVVLEPLKILKHYLRTYLLVDIISSLPWDHITLPWRRIPGEDVNHIIIIINLLPLLKLIRYGYVNLQVFELFSYFEIMHFYYQMLTTLMLGLYLILWSSCLCYLIPVLVLHFQNTLAKDCVNCWMTGLDSGSISLRFQHSLFIVLEKIAASGYGMYVPRTDGHLLLSSSLMIMGRLLECYIVVMLIQIKAIRKASKSKFLEIMNQLTAYTRQKQLPPQMKNRLLAYYQYRFRNSYFREKWLLSHLSESLCQEIALQSSHRLVQNVAIFKMLPEHVLRMIVKNLKFELYLPNDVIVKSGAQGDCMFFLSAGTVAVLTPTGKEICHLEDGAHFGEVALLVPDQRRVASVVAIEVCEVYRLERKDFRKCIAVHTELFANIERIAADRIEKALLIEEQHKRYLMRDSLQTDDVLA